MARSEFNLDRAPRVDRRSVKRSCLPLLQRFPQHFRQVLRLLPRDVLDLLVAGNSGGDDLDGSI
jgi:hypothetical protein